MPFAINAQLLATRGYAILLVGARVCPDTRMQDIFKSVLPGIHSVIESGIADPERIGVMGQSDGGYAALALLVQSKIFKAAVITSGYSNILTLESYDQGRSIMRESEDFTATAWHDRHIAIENSPYFYLNRVQTPTLMTHGGDDNSIPEASVKELFGAFQDLGKEAVFVEYEGEGHGPLYYSYEHQVDLSGRIVQWFDKYLKGQSK
jgi:dipeptidyl aminopeptidase/acylaminoacyl peptidase